MPVINPPDLQNSTTPITHHKTGWNAIPLYGQVLMLIGSLVGFFLLLVIGNLDFAWKGRRERSNTTRDEPTERSKRITNEEQIIMDLQMQNAREREEMRSKLTAMQIYRDVEREELKRKLDAMRREMEADRRKLEAMRREGEVERVEVRRRIGEMEGRWEGLPEYSEA